MDIFQDLLAFLVADPLVQTQIGPNAGDDCCAGQTETGIDIDGHWQGQHLPKHWLFNQYDT